MDDYLGLFSDSWSIENDVPTGESISNNSRDYTIEFTTDQIFKSREDMINWAKTIGLENGIVVVIKNSANLKGGKLPKCHLMCERGGKYKPPRYLVDGQSLKRNTGTKKCECPFELRGIPIPPDGVMWGLRVVCGFHNHQLAEYTDGHEYPSRLKPIEKEFVLDMADSTTPREILSILKERDPSNTTGIKSIYNAIFTNKSAKRGGLNSIQYVLDQLIKKEYLHNYRTNPDTNEITDILWVHPRSLELYVNFSSVLIIDATYKTNEYQIPLLKVVGITSTMRTYSLMFAYLSNERTEQLTWALDTLKKWMVEKNASLPLVFVSDRDLALINAIETCFPNASHILCIWHINQCIMKKCAPMLGLEWQHFNASWHSLINSSTQWSYQQKWNVMCKEYQRFEGVLNYLWDTWLHPYKERFVSAWVDTYMHLGSNSNQRAESAHARLKLYLGDTMSSLQTSFEKIHKMLRIQFGDIKKSFKRSLNIPRHQHLHDDIFSQIRCRISLEAMELISGQLKCIEEASHQLADKCNCSIKIVYGLPCEHDLAHYRYFSIPIPLQSINIHWKRLSMHVHQCNDEGAQPNRASHIVEILDGMDPHMREHMIDKFFDMIDPSQSTVRAPSYNTEHRGRPVGRDEQSGRRIPSFADASTSGSRVSQPTATSRGRGRRGRGSKVYNTQMPHDHSPVPPIHDTYIEKLPMPLQRYISHTIDVQPDGHCGFRAIAALIGYGEEGWFQVRFDLIEEIQQNKDLYDQLYPDQNLVANLLFSLNWFEPWTPEMYWMDSMPLGIVIALRYNLVLHTFGENVGSCFTHLPLRTPPVPNQERREIAIAHIGNHFVQVFLHPHYPVPPIPTWWWQHSSYEAKGWITRYRTRVHLWYEVIGIPPPNASGAEFEGNID